MTSCRLLLPALALFLGCASQKAEVTPPPASPTPAAEARPAPATPVAEARPAPVPPRLRLGDAAKPLRYSARLTVVPTEDTFQGAIDIELSVREPLPVLWLNANELSLQRAEARVQGQTLPGTPISTERDFVGISFARPLPAGTATLHLEYTGRLSRKDSDGAFRQKEGEDWYVFTHFEPIDARRVFPCFDEPSFKVPWQLSLRVKQGDRAFSNTPVEAEARGDDGFTTWRFAQTRPLPSYLIAFAVGPLERVDAGPTGKKGTPVGIIVPRGMTARARFAAQSIPQELTLLEDYFGTPFPFEKLDFIAVPLIGGAMENPGLITFSLPGILSRPEEETIGFRRRCANVSIHEMAHLWFGDLVTTAWWDDLWLNEAFATWMTPKIVERWKPEWAAPVNRVSSRSSAMQADSLLSARRIRQPIESDNDMKNAFDGITYGKGAAVIDMFESWVGPERFQRGVRRHLAEHAYGNATAAEFLTAISAEAGKDVAPAFSTFLDQAGVPLVSVALRCEKGQPPRLELAQQRYFPLGSEGAAAGTPPQRWQIPLCARWGRGRQQGRACTLLAEEKGSLALEAAGCPDWVFPNDGEVGYYRVAPEGDLLGRLLDDGGQRLSVPERIGVLGDLAALVRAGRLPYAEALKHAAKLARDKDPHVVKATVTIVDGLYEAGLVPEAQRSRYAAFIRETYGARTRALGWKERPGEDEDTRLLRESLLSVMGEQGEDPQVIAQAKSLTDAWLTDHRSVSPELVPVALNIAATQGGRALFERWRDAATREKDRHDRLLLLEAMGQFRDPELVKATLALTLSDALDPRESIRLLYGAIHFPAGRPVAYQFLKENFDALVARLPRDTAASFPRIGASLCDDSRRAEVEAFFKDSSTRFLGGPRQLAQALEFMRLCSALRKSQGPSVEEFLQGVSQPTRNALPR